MSDSSVPLTPPEPLAPPAPVAPLTPQEAIAKVTLSADQTAKLDAQVAAFGADLATLPVDGDGFRDRVKAIDALGSSEIARSASVSNRLLERPARAMRAGLFDGSSDVTKSLLDLRNVVERLDPATQGDLFAPRKLFNLIPLGPRIRDYFRSYESSQAQLDAIIHALYASRDQLLRDNADIEQERENVWTLMGTLEQFAYVAARVAAAVEAQAQALDASDPARAKALREDVLFDARQKQQDIATQQAVNVQGYLALDLIRRNNAELVKGIDRATTTTVAALRTAILVAQALTDQKLVLDQIRALNATTSTVIADTSRMLRQNAARVGEQAASSGVSIAALQSAFADTKAALDGISEYKAKALVSFEQTVSTLEPLIADAKSYVAAQRDVAP